MDTNTGWLYLKDEVHRVTASPQADSIATKRFSTFG